MGGYFGRIFGGNPTHAEDDVLPTYHIHKKIVIVGDTGSGKTSLLTVFSNRPFPEDDVPQVLGDFVVTYKTFRLEFVDTGENDHESLRPAAYKDADVILMCFSIDKPDSLENLRSKWVPEVQRHCPKVPIVLVGNKKDLRSNDNSVKAMDSRAIAKEIGAAYRECSAKQGEGVTDILEAAIQKKPN